MASVLCLYFEGLILILLRVQRRQPALYKHTCKFAMYKRKADTSEGKRCRCRSRCYYVQPPDPLNCKACRLGARSSSLFSTLVCKLVHLVCTDEAAARRRRCMTTSWRMPHYFLTTCIFVVSSGPAARFRLGLLGWGNTLRCRRRRFVVGVLSAWWLSLSPRHTLIYTQCTTSAKQWLRHQFLQHNQIGGCFDLNGMFQFCWRVVSNGGGWYIYREWRTPFSNVFFSHGEGLCLY